MCAFIVLPCVDHVQDSIPFSGEQRGYCDCEKDMCVCDAIAPLTGQRYSGFACQCNPDDCYNARTRVRSVYMTWLRCSQVLVVCGTFGGLG